MSAPEDDLAIRLKALKIPFVREWRFRGTTDDRRWRFDFLLLPEELKIAIEVEGGVFVGGRHTRGKGFTNDLMKYNAALMMGFSVLRYTTAQINGIAMEQIPELYAKKSAALTA